MTYVILLNLCVVLFFISFVVKCFKKIFIGCLAMNYIVIYSITIIPNILNKVDNSMEFGIIKYLLT